MEDSSVIILHCGENIGSAPSGRIAVVPAKRAGTSILLKPNLVEVMPRPVKGVLKIPQEQAQKVTAVSDAVSQDRYRRHQNPSGRGNKRPRRRKNGPHRHEIGT